MILVLCYDIVEDKRRGRMFRQLKRFLVPVQESVFEGELAEKRWKDLLRTVERNLNPETDTVRIYQLCRACHGITTLMGVSPSVVAMDESEVITQEVFPWKH